MGFPSPRFNIKLSEDETAETFVSLVEQEARAVAGDIPDREYLAWRVIAGAMPCLNRIFVELDIHYKDRPVPTKVLRSVAKKERKAAMKNVTIAVEAKKRKGAGRGKVISKRWRVGDASAAASVGSR